MGEVEPDTVMIAEPEDATVSLLVSELEDETDPADGRAFCVYRDAVARARAEAADHPDIMKLVLVDELTQSLRSPLQVWGGQTAAFGAPEVALLQGLANEAATPQFDFAADFDADTVRKACDDAIATAAVAELDLFGSARSYVAQLDVPVVPDESFPGDEAHPAEAPVELWARVNAATVPLFLLPSVLLGFPGGVPLADVDVGATQLARWTVKPAVSLMDVPFHRVRLRALVTPFAAAEQPVELFARVNGARVPGSMLTTNKAHFPRRYAELENVYLIDVVLADTTWSPASSAPSLGPAPTWSSAALVNAVDLAVQVYDAPAAPGGFVYGDLAAAFFGARIIYEDAFGNVIAEQPLKVEDASFYVRDAGGGEAACDAAMLCETNAAYRVDNLLDGLTIAQDITTNWPAPSELDVPSLQVAWDEFIGYACDRFGRAKGPGGARNRCLVDERAWVSQAEWVASLNIDDAKSRLSSGSNRGDGGVLLWFTLELEDLLELGGAGLWGRFAEREPIDEAYPYLAYLPRLTRNIIGEGIVWEVQVEDLTDVACRGDWTVNWRMDSCPAKWTYGAVGEVWDPDLDGGSWVDSFFNTHPGAVDPELDRPFYQLIEQSTGVACADAPTAAGTYTIELTELAEGRLRFGWEIKDDDAYPSIVGTHRFDVGDSRTTPQYVEMNIAPPPGCGSEYTTTQSAVANKHVLDYFDAISDYLAGL
jgi:hypothetical protein